MQPLKEGDKVKIKTSTPYVDKEITDGLEGTLYQKGNLFSLIILPSTDDLDMKEVLTRDLRPIK